CTSNVCMHDGKMAIGHSRMECICKGEWDGHYCERLACWRLTDMGGDKRYRNDKATNSCKCGTHYAGEKCDVIKSCEKKGRFENGACICEEGFGGALCEKKCAPGLLT
ncbi:hypothetical protein PFISCL1PPCAC_28629, partial [Pristionchus fissidentatus]